MTTAAPGHAHKYRFISAEAGNFALATLCKARAVSRSA
jgi:hypothetical protein